MDSFKNKSDQSFSSERRYSSGGGNNNPPPIAPSEKSPEDDWLIQLSQIIGNNPLAPIIHHAVESGEKSVGFSRNSRFDPNNAAITKLIIGEFQVTVYFQKLSEGWSLVHLKLSKDGRKQEANVNVKERMAEIVARRLGLNIPEEKKYSPEEDQYESKITDFHTWLDRILND